MQLLLLLASVHSLSTSHQQERHVSVFVSKSKINGNSFENSTEMTTPNYNILATDYTNYVVVHSCTSLFIINFQFAWVLSRTRTLSAANQAIVTEVLRSNGVSLKHFSETSQTNCPALRTWY